MIDINTKNISIIGAGAFGTSIARILANKYTDKKIKIWSYENEVASEINSNHLNSKYLPNIDLPKNIYSSSKIDEILKDIEILLIVVPSKAFSHTLKTIKNKVSENTHIAYLTKGFGKHKGHYSPLSDIIFSIINNKNICAISGPTHAEELSKDYYTSFMIGGQNNESCKMFKDLLTTNYTSCKVTNDILGVELGGALKNPIAIAAGIISQIPNCGDNIEGAMLAEGFKEMIELAKVFNAKVETMHDISGLGDLIATSLSNHSRNRKFGIDLYNKISNSKKNNLFKFLKKKISLPNESEKMSYLAEGAYALEPVINIANKNNIKIPLLRSLNEVLVNNIDFSFMIEVLKNTNEYENVLKQYNKNHIYHKRKKDINIKNEIHILKKRISEHFSVKNNKDNVINFCKSEINSKYSKILKNIISATNEKKYKIYVENLSKLYLNEIHHKYKFIVFKFGIKIIKLIGFFRKINVFKSNIKININKKNIRLKNDTNNIFISELNNIDDLLFILLAFYNSKIKTPRIFFPAKIKANRFIKYIIKCSGVSFIENHEINNPIYYELIKQYFLISIEQNIPILIFNDKKSNSFYNLFLDTYFEKIESIPLNKKIIPIQISYYSKPVISLNNDNNFVIKKIMKNKGVVKFSDAISINKDQIIDKNFKNELSNRIEICLKTLKPIYDHYIFFKILAKHNYVISFKELKKELKHFIKNKNLTSSHNYKKIMKIGIKFIKKYKIGEINKQNIKINDTEFADYFSNQVNI